MNDKARPFAGKSITSLSSSIQASAPGDQEAAVISIGENREHLSLLSGSKRQYGVSRSVRASSRLTNSALNSSHTELEDSLIDSNSLSISIPLKHRMSMYYRLLVERHPKGKATYYVFLIYFLESVAFFGSLTAVRQLLPGAKVSTSTSQSDNKSSSSYDLESFILSLLYSSAGRILYPVAGVLADSYLGRYRVIHIGLWLLWIGFAVNSLSLGLINLLGHAKYVIAVLSIILFCAGSGSVEATLIPFGVDQLSQGASSDELSSYFYYYYMARNLGAMIGFLLSVIVFDAIDIAPSTLTDTYSNSTAYMYSNVQYVTQSLFAVVSITIALLVLFCLKKLFYQDRQHSNALKLICNVFTYAATVKRQIPQYNRSFRYGEERKSRIDLTKIEFDGIFNSEDVEDVKTFYRMLFFLLSLFGYFITYGAGYSYLTSQLANSAVHVISDGSKHTFLAVNIIFIINSGTILLALPIINHILIPLRPTVNMKLKLGVGFFVHVLSFGFAGFIQWRADTLTQQQFFYWMIVPTVLLSLGENLVFVSGLEFIYAQSPNNMKGLQTGLFYLIYGIFTAIGSSLYFGVNLHSTETRSLTAWLCFILLVIGTVGLVVYVCVACCYKNRQRPTADGSEHETARRMIYEDVFDTST